MSRTEYALLITIVSVDRLVRDKCCYGIPSILPISDVGAALVDSTSCDGAMLACFSHVR